MNNLKKVQLKSFCCSVQLTKILYLHVLQKHQTQNTQKYIHVSISISVSLIYNSTVYQAKGKRCSHYTTESSAGRRNSVSVKKKETCLVFLRLKPPLRSDSNTLEGGKKRGMRWTRDSRNESGATLWTTEGGTMRGDEWGRDGDGMLGSRGDGRGEGERRRAKGFETKVKGTLW